MPENTVPTDALRSPGQAAQVIVWAADALRSSGQAADTLPAEPQVDTRLEYRGANGATGFCRLRVYRDRFHPDPRARIVVISDQPGNADNLSITNAIEEIATQVVNRFGFDPARTIFIQHYPPGTEDYADRDESFDRVRLRWADAEGGQPYALSPAWSCLYVRLKDGSTAGGAERSDMAIRLNLGLPAAV